MKARLDSSDLQNTELNQTSKNWFDILISISLMVLIWGVWFLFSGKNVTTIIIKGSFFEILAPFILGIWVIKRISSESKVLSSSWKIFLPFFIWLGLLCLSSLLSDYPHRSFPTLYKYICLGGLFFVTAEISSNQKLLKNWVNFGFIGAATIVALYGFLQIFEIDFYPWKLWLWEKPYRRINSSFGNPDFFSGALVLSIPITISLFFSSFTEKKNLGIKVFFSLSLILQIVSMIFTWSRGGLLGLFGAGFAGCFIWYFGARTVPSKSFSHLLKQWKPVLIFGGILAITGIIIIFVVLSTGMFDECLRLKGGSIMARGHAYQGSLNMMKDSLFLGHGLGTFSIYFPDFRPVDLTLYKPPHYYAYHHAHSEFLEVGSELGLIGLFVFFWIIFTVFTAGLKGLHRVEKGTFAWWFLIGSMAAIFGILTQNIFTVNLRKIPCLLIFWVLMGAVLGIVSKWDSRKSHKPKLLSIIISIPVIVLVLFMVKLPFERFKADQLVYQGLKAMETGQPEATRWFLKGIRKDPYRADAHYWLAATYFQGGDYDRTIEEYEKCINLERNYVDVMFNLATTYIKMEDFKKAEGLFKKALEDNPYYARLHDYLGRVYMIKEQPEKAKKAWDDALKYYDVELYNNDLNQRTRYDKVKLLLVLERYEEALPEAEKLAARHKNNKTYQTLYKELVKVNEQIKNSKQ